MTGDQSAGYYPVSLQLRGRSVVVIGGGAIVEQKVTALLACGAHVSVIGERQSPVVDQFALRGEIALARRPYRRGDLEGTFLAIAAPDDRAENAAIWREAEERGVLLNAVDDVEHCHFIAPAVHRHGDVTVAISTGGASPALAVRLREAIARIVRPEHGRLAALLGALRKTVAERVPDVARRTALWFRIVDSDTLELLVRDDELGARLRVETLVRQAVSDTAVPAAPAPSRRPSVGFVSLVGAGPGRASLITLAGLRALRAADAVVYDRLTHPALVRAAPPSARRIFVGKIPGARGGVRQETINALLVDLARRGQRVVRLKGGDPFVFGRGAEECETLRAAHVPFEVIPGVSSAIAAPGAAGIPVTHRDHASAFAVVTGESAGSAPALDWHALARMQTLVVLMGLRTLPDIVARLRAHGASPDTPAAVIANATLPHQREIVGTIGTIGQLVAEARLTTPATLVVGDVVGVRHLIVEPRDGRQRKLDRSTQRLSPPRKRGRVRERANHD
jgi:uroporphyrin-III C-methyltransferase/precorrin-2 dehydrogenase/sirohydrochlorin ferrochelatase